MGISAIFQWPLTVPLQSLHDRKMPIFRAVQGDCVRVYFYTQPARLFLFICHQTHWDLIKMALIVKQHFQMLSLSTKYLYVKYRPNWNMSFDLIRQLCSGNKLLLSSNSPWQWNLYNKTREVWLKTHKFQHLSGTLFTKPCLYSLSWETTCLERPQNLVVALHRFHCTWTNVDQDPCHHDIGTDFIIHSRHYLQMYHVWRKYI